MSIFESVMKGLNEAVEYEKGNLKNIKTNKIIISPLPHYTKDTIRDIRNSLQLTQRAFAEIMGVSQKTVEAWECGKNTPQGPAQRMLEILKKDSQILTKYHILELENLM